jgi:tetrahydromethanopterin S-methyltransferase subunit D
MKKIEPEKAEQVKPPTEAPPPPGIPTVAFVGIGASIGAKLGGASGALVGGALGWAADAVRRRLLA